MGKFTLQIKATLENCTNLHIPGPDYSWTVRLRCSSCSESSDKWHGILATQTFPLTGSKGDANFIIKCKLCGRQNSVNVLIGTFSQYTADHSESFNSFIGFDCRGVEPFDFSPRGELRCTSLDGARTYKNIDLSQGDWAEYDDVDNVPLGIYDFECKFV